MAVFPGADIMSQHGRKKYYGPVLLWHSVFSLIWPLAGDTGRKPRRSQSSSAWTCLSDERE